jgi:hypothetical protein
MIFSCDSGLTRIILQSVAKQRDILQPISALAWENVGERGHGPVIEPPPEQRKPKRLADRAQQPAVLLLRRATADG